MVRAARCSPDRGRSPAGPRGSALSPVPMPPPGQQLRQTGQGNTRPGCIPHTCGWMCWGQGDTQGRGVTPLWVPRAPHVPGRKGPICGRASATGAGGHGRREGGEAFKLILLQPHGGCGGCGRIPDPGSARGAGPVPGTQLGCSREGARLGAAGLGTPGDGYGDHDHAGPGSTGGCTEPPPHECLSFPTPLQEHEAGAGVLQGSWWC